MGNIVKKAFLYLLMACTFCAASFICVTRLFVTVDFPINMDSNYVACLKYFFDFPSFILSIILIILFLFLFYKLRIHNHIKKQHLEIIIFIWVFLVGIFTQKLFEMQSFEDGYFILQAALSFLNSGKDTFISSYGSYFRYFPYQIGFLGFVTLVASLTDNVVNTIQIFQVFIFAIACVIFSKLFNDNKRKIIYFSLLVLFYTPIAMCCYFYGFSLGLSFAMISIYFVNKYLNTKYNINLIYSMIFLVLSILFKTNFTLLVIAYIILFLLEENIIRVKFLQVACCIAVVFITNSFNSFVGNQIYGLDVSNKQTMLAYMVMGGIHTGEEEYRIRDNSLPGRFDGYVTGPLDEKDLIVSDLINQVKYISNNPAEALKFYWYKAISTFNSNDMNAKLYLASNNTVALDENRYISSLNGGKLSLMIDLANNLFMFLYFIGMIFSVKSNDKIAVLAKLIFVGGISHVMLLETKPIYFYPWIMLSLPSAVNGLIMIGENIYKKVNIEKKSKIILALVIGVCLIGTVYNLHDRLFETKLDQITIDKQDYYFIQKFTFKEANINVITGGYFGYLNDDKITVQLLLDNKDITEEIEVNNDINLREIYIKKKNNSNFANGDYTLVMKKEGQSSTIFGFLSNDEKNTLRFYKKDRKLFIYYDDPMPNDNVNEHIK